MSQEPLSNQRHELFAQEVAKGATADEAYASAGFRPNRGNAATLKANQSVAARIADLQSQASGLAVVTAASITMELLSIGKEAKALGDAAGFSVARAAYMDVAKLNGLIVDKAEIAASVRNIVCAEPLSEDDWEKKHCHDGTELH